MIDALIKYQFQFIFKMFAFGNFVFVILLEKKNCTLKCKKTHTAKFQTKVHRQRRHSQTSVTIVINAMLVFRKDYMAAIEFPFEQHV